MQFISASVVPSLLAPANPPPRGRTCFSSCFANTLRDQAGSWHRGGGGGGTQAAIRHGIKTRQARPGPEGEVRVTMARIHQTLLAGGHPDPECSSSNPGSTPGTATPTLVPGWARGAPTAGGHGAAKPRLCIQPKPSTSSPAPPPPGAGAAPGSAGMGPKTPRRGLVSPPNSVETEALAPNRPLPSTHG